MVFRSLLAACGLAAVFSVSSLAQSTPSQTPQTPAQQPSAPAPAPPANQKLQFQDLPPDPHTPSAAEQEQRHQQAVLNAAMRLASMQAHWGPDMNSPGLSIALAEVSRTRTPQGTSITYQITGSGFSPDEKLMLVRWPLNAEAHSEISGISFDAKGIAVCSETAPVQPPAPTSAAPDPSLEAPVPASGPGAASTPNAKSAAPEFSLPPSCGITMKPQQPIEIQTTAAPAEAIRVAIMAGDRKHGAAVSAVPFPIASTDKGCKLDVILSMKDAAMVLIEGTGFPPNTPLKLSASTGADTRELHPKTNAEGRIVVPLLTGAKGQTTGETTVKFAGLNRQPTLDTTKEPAQPDLDCAPAVSFHWGEGTYKTE
jgi:hypothetical protein